MRFFRQYSLFFFLVFAFFVVRNGRCNFGDISWGRGKRIHASGATTKTMRPLSGFTRLAVQVPADVEISQDSTFSVELEGATNILNVVETILEGNILRIRIQKGFSIDGKDLRVRIRAPQYEGISLAGSGLIVAKTGLKSVDFDLNVAGSGKVELLSLETPNLSISVAGSGDVICNGGSVETTTISIAGSGDVRVSNLVSKNTEVSIAGSGNCRVQATEKLTASVSGSGDIFYKGTPVLVTRISGSGTVKQE